MYLTDLINNSNSNSNSLIGSITEKVVFESNPLVNIEPQLDNEIVTKKYLFRILETIFGPNFFENKLNYASAVSVYILNITNAECIEGGKLTFELSISPMLLANLRIKLSILDSTAVSGVDFENVLQYSLNNTSYIDIQDNILNIPNNTEKLYIQIQSKERDSLEYYGDKILVVKINEIVLYDSPENPYFIFNDIGIGKIKEKKAKPNIYEMTVSNSTNFKSEPQIFELNIDKPISNLKLRFELNNLTAIDTINYDKTHLEVSYNNGISWSNLILNELVFTSNYTRILLKIPTINIQSYSGDKVFILNINNILEKPDNSIVNIINNNAIGTIRDQYLPTVDAHLNLIDAFCNEGDDLIFESEIIIPPPNIINSQIVIYYDIKNISAYSGLDYNEVMSYSYDSINWINTSTREVIYNNNYKKVKIKLHTIYRNEVSQTRYLLLYPKEILQIQNNLNLKITDSALGTIRDISPLIENYLLTIEDSNVNEGDYAVCDIYSDKALTQDIVLNLNASNITAIENIDYTNKVQYSINSGSTWIDGTFNNIIFPKNLTNIKIRYLTIKNSFYTGFRSFMVKIKKIEQVPSYFNINYSDIGVITISDLDTHPVNYQIKFENKDFSVVQGSDFIFSGYVYPPLVYDGLELELSITSIIARENIDYSFRFSSFTTNNGISWSSVSNAHTIILNKATNYFKIKIPTFQNLSNNVIKDIEFKISKIVYNTPNSNFDFTEAIVNTNIKTS